MEQDNVVELRRPDERSGDPLTEVLRHGARALLAQAIEAEAAAFLAAHADLVDGAGRQRWCTTASCRKALRQLYGAAREQRRWGHEAPLALYDFRAEHWKHVRIANPIEGTFATVRLRTTKIKDCLSRQTALAIVLPTVPERNCARAPSGAGVASTDRAGSPRSSTACASSTANAESRTPPDVGPYTRFDNTSLNAHG